MKNRYGVNVSSFKNNNNKKGVVFNIQRFCIYDGPGVRTIVFLKGCPLRCVWCCNPEGQNTGMEIAFYKDRCLRCGRCIEACPEKAIILDEYDYPLVNRTKCKVCGKCAEVCPVGARKVFVKRMTTDHGIEEIKKDELLYLNSGGGVTLSGGEPLVQSDFAEEILRKCKEKCINTAIETCAFGDWQDLKKMLEYSDLILCDLKIIDNTMSKKFTGITSDRILKNIRKISQSGKPMIIRVPLIPGITTSRKNILDIINFLKELKYVEKVDLLPYHSLGEAKYCRLGENYTLTGLKSPNEEFIAKIVELFHSSGFDTTSRGEFI